MNQDTKFEPRDGGFWHRQGGYFVPGDEPLCVLRGKDLFVPPVIDHYIGLALQEAAACEAAGEPKLAAIASEHAASMTERRDTILAWQVANPERSGLGCHTCAESGTLERLRHSNH